MRNRAKCVKCSDIIESLTSQDHVVCSCGAIEVFGGQDKMGCVAKDWGDFLRVDDNGNEIKPKIVDGKPDKEQLLSIMNEMISKIEEMPPMALSVSVNHYDLLSVLYWLRSMFSVES